MLKMEELMTKYSLGLAQLDCELESEDLLILSNYFDKDAADRCIHAIPTLTPADQGDAREKTSIAFKVHHCLSMWRQHKPSEATYRALLALVLSEKLNQRSDIAEKICKHLSDKHGTVPPAPVSLSIPERQKVTPPAPDDIPSVAHDQNSLGSSSSGISEPSQEKYVTLTCGCGKCSILGYISGKDKCSSAEPPKITVVEIQFPKSSSATLEEHVTTTQISESLFKRALQRETLKMHRHFTKLLHETFEELEEKFVFRKVKAFSQTLVSGGNYSHIYTSSVGLSQKLNDFDQLREFIQDNYCSWFNFDIIEALREQFLFPSGLEQADQALDKYKQVFKEYVNRRCFLYADHLGPHPQVDSVKVVCKIDVDFDSINYDQIQDIKIIFVNCVHLSKYKLVMERVREGCTELHFRLLGTRDYTLTLSPQQKEHLRALGFVSITAGSQQNVLEVPSSNADIACIGICEFNKGDENELLDKFQAGGDPINAVVLLDTAAEKGFDVNLIFDEDGMTLLHLACQWDWSKWGIVVERLVDQHKSDILATNRDDETPLDVAARFNNDGAAKYLTTFSPHIPVQSALQIAHDKQHERVLEVLTEVAADMQKFQALFLGEDNISSRASLTIPGNHQPTPKRCTGLVTAKKLRGSNPTFNDPETRSSERRNKVKRQDKKSSVSTSSSESELYQDELKACLITQSETKKDKMALPSQKHSKRKNWKVRAFSCLSLIIAAMVVASIVLVAILLKYFDIKNQIAENTYNVSILAYENDTVFLGDVDANYVSRATVVERTESGDSVHLNCVYLVLEHDAAEYNQNLSFIQNTEYQNRSTRIGGLIRDVYLYRGLIEYTISATFATNFATGDGSVYIFDNLNSFEEYQNGYSPNAIFTQRLNIGTLDVFESTIIHFSATKPGYYYIVASLPANVYFNLTAIITQVYFNRLDYRPECIDVNELNPCQIDLSSLHPEVYYILGYAKPNSNSTSPTTHLQLSTSRVSESARSEREAYLYTSVGMVSVLALMPIIIILYTCVIGLCCPDCYRQRKAQRNGHEDRAHLI